MYVPPHFAEARPEELHRVMREHPLGMLVSHGPQGLDAEHLPFEFSPESGPLGLLSSHVARANPVWQRCPTGTPVMVVFSSAQAYISPNWYPSKHQTHRQVPTWNYRWCMPTAG
jgi:transcriptional regulator